MIGFKIDQAKSRFFDSGAVMRSVDQLTRKVLSLFGARTRRDARRTLRRSRKSAAAGRPPKSHKGLIKRFLFFVFDPVRESVVVGPAKLNAPRDDDALEVLEYGGITTRRLGGKRLRVNYPGNPFMEPVFEKNLPSVQQMWRDQAI